MSVITTAEPVITTNEDSKGNSHSLGMLNPLISTLDANDYSTLKQQYGAYWGNLKFENAPDNYSNDVSLSLLLFTLRYRNFKHGRLCNCLLFFDVRLVSDFAD